MEVRMTYREFQFLLLLWKMGVVDTFNVLKICANCGSQYMGIVLSSAAGNFSEIGPKVLLEPVSGLGTGIQFVSAAATIAEKRQRIATLAAFLATSGAALTTDPTTNAAVGGAIASKIAYMRAMLMRGGGICKQAFEYRLMPSLKDCTIISDPVQAPLVNYLKVHPYRTEFACKSKTIIDSMFADHTARRYASASASVSVVKKIVVNNLNPVPIVGWGVFSLALVGFVGIGGLALFQRAERHHHSYTYLNKQDFIDVTD